MRLSDAGERAGVAVCGVQATPSLLAGALVSEVEEGDVCHRQFFSVPPGLTACRPESACLVVGVGVGRVRSAKRNENSERGVWPVHD